MQRHPFKQIILHLDFQRVDAKTEVRISVPLHFINEDESPAGKASDVVVTHEMNEVEVTCLPKDLPEFLEVDLAALDVGMTIHLSEVKLPKGVEIPELKLGKEHDVANAGSRRSTGCQGCRYGRRQVIAHRSAGHGGRTACVALHRFDGWSSPYRRAGKSRTRTRPDPAQCRVLVY